MAHESPLREQHVQAEASLVPYGPLTLPVEMVETFGEVDFEYAALRKGCVLLDLPMRGTLEVGGEDRLAFLNNMVTQELRGMEPFRSRRAFWLNRKGRIVSDLRLTEVGDRLLVDLDVHTVEATAESLSGYVISEDVEVRDVTDRLHRLALHGPTTPVLLAAVCKQAEDGSDGPAVSDLAPGTACRALIAGREVVIEREDITGEFGAHLTMGVEAAREVYQTLVERGSPTNGEGAATLPGRVRLRQTGWLAVNMARIEAGTAMLFLDFTTEALPAECGERAMRERVSFTKGCYLGQEVVARMHSLGKPKQVIVGLSPEGDPPRDERGLARQPVSGASVMLSAGAGEPGDQVGMVTSSTISPMLGGVPIALATLRTSAAVDGAVVLVAAEGVIMPMRVRLDARFYARES